MSIKYKKSVLKKKKTTKTIRTLMLNIKKLSNKCTNNKYLRLTLQLAHLKNIL